MAESMEGVIEPTAEPAAFDIDDQQQGMFEPQGGTDED